MNSLSRIPTRLTIRLLFPLVALLSVFPLNAQENGRTLLVVDGLFDGTDTTRQDQRTTVVIRGSVIEAIETGRVPTQDGDQVIRLEGHTLLPGMIDLHVHLLSESNPASYLQRFTSNPADLAIKGTVYARRTLEAGFTTVRDLGGETTAIKALRDGINNGMVVGPRILAATASLATTGGHGDPSNGLSEALAFHPTADDGVVNSPSDARQAVRARYKAGADTIKITATGGVLSMAKNGQNPQFTEEEIRAVVDAANDYGFIVAAHAHGAEGIKRAVRGGVTTIEHGTFMDEEAFELMKQHGTWFVPTISAGRFVAEKAKIPGYFPEIIRPKAAEIGPVIQETAGAAYRAGVKIAFGTDCGVCPHGSNGKELGYMVEAGMPAAEALVAATRSAAEVLRLEGEIGTIEVGKQADLIAVPGNPLESIEIMEAPTFVMKGGTVFKQSP